jgi:integrase
MPVYWSKAESRWRFEFDRRIKGRRYRLTKLLPKGWDRDQAEAFDRDESARLYAESKGLAQPRLPLDAAVKLYMEHRLPSLKNGHKAMQDLAHLYHHINGAALDEVSDIAQRYKIEQADSLAPATIRNRLAYLKAAVRYAYREHKYGDRDHSDRMSLPAPNNERQVYARMAELNKLWRAIREPEARALFKMDFYMGLRWRAELLSRRREHIVRNRKDVWLEIGKTKNGRPVMKPVHPAVIDCLKFIPFQHSDAWFYDRWHEATEAIGRPDLLPHDLRHSLASEIASRGGTLDDVRAALHHESVQASKRYTHLYPERTKAVLLAVGQKFPQPKAKKRAAGGRKSKVSV